MKIGHTYISKYTQIKPSSVSFNENNVLLRLNILSKCHALNLNWRVSKRIAGLPCERSPRSGRTDNNLILFMSSVCDIDVRLTTLWNKNRLTTQDKPLYRN